MLLDHIKPIDSRDDRTEIFFLLGFLTPAERVAFLQWACDVVNERSPAWGRVIITESTGEVAEAYWDLMLLVAQRDLQLDAVLRRLEKLASAKPLARGI